MTYPRTVSFSWLLTPADPGPQPGGLKDKYILHSDDYSVSGATLYLIDNETWEVAQDYNGEGKVEITITKDGEDVTSTYLSNNVFDTTFDMGESDYIQYEFIDPISGANEIPFNCVVTYRYYDLEFESNSNFELRQESFKKLSDWEYDVEYKLMTNFVDVSKLVNHQYLFRTDILFKDGDEPTYVTSEYLTSQPDFISVLSDSGLFYFKLGFTINPSRIVSSDGEAGYLQIKVTLDDGTIVTCYDEYIDLEEEEDI